MVDPTYVRISDGQRPLRIAASRRSRSEQIVRVSAAEVPSKLSKIWWFDTVELRPSHLATKDVEVSVPGVASYWLAIRVFSSTGCGWSRSTLGRDGGAEVPPIELMFNDARVEGDHDEAQAGVTVTIMYV